MVCVPVLSEMEASEPREGAEGPAAAAIANGERPAGADNSMGYLPGSVPIGVARSGGRIVRRSVVHTPRHWETGRPRAAQFAPWAVYILGWRDDVVQEGRCAG